MIKNLKTLVLDSDANSSRKMTSTLERVFNHIYVQNGSALYRKELGLVKPDVVFINLTINQREEGFTVLEWLGELEKLPLVYGYTNEMDSDLFAHAVENGFLHIFTAEPDTEEVITTISRHFKESEALIRDLACYKLHPPFPAEVELELSLVQIDENGFKLRSPHYISKGTSFDLTETFISEIFGVNSVSVMVTKTSQSDDEENYDLFVEPKDIKEPGMALRRYVMSRK